MADDKTESKRASWDTKWWENGAKDWKGEGRGVIEDKIMIKKKGARGYSFSCDVIGQQKKKRANFT